MTAAGLCRALLVGVFVGGCGGSPTPDASSITGLHFTTSSMFADNPQPTNVDVTLTDAGRARAIYEATVELPSFPSGTYHCPSDLGYRHTIAFTEGEQTAVIATLNTGGCRDATISDAPPVRQTNSAYWSLLARHLGVEESTLFETATQ